MASRSFSPTYHSNLIQPIEISLNFLIAAGPAVGAIQGRFLHPTTPVVRTGAGLYTIMLADNYTSLRGCSIIVATAAANVDLYGQLDLAYNTLAAGGATFPIRLKTAGVNADPALADQVFVKLLLSNSGRDP